MPQLTIQYTPTLTLPTYYSRKEPILTSILTLPHTSNQTIIPPFIHTLPNTVNPFCTTYPPPSNYNRTYHPQKSPKHGTIANLPSNISPHTNPLPLPPSITNILPLHFPPTQSYYTDTSFNPVDGEGNGNIASLGVFNAPPPSTSIL